MRLDDFDPNSVDIEDQRGGRCNEDDCDTFTDLRR